MALVRRINAKPPKMLKQIAMTSSVLTRFMVLLLLFIVFTSLF